MYRKLPCFNARITFLFLITKFYTNTTRSQKISKYGHTLFCRNNSTNKSTRQWARTKKTKVTRFCTNPTRIVTGSRIIFTNSTRIITKICTKLVTLISRLDRRRRRRKRVHRRILFDLGRRSRLQIHPEGS